MLLSLLTTQRIYNIFADICCFTVIVREPTVVKSRAVCAEVMSPVSLFSDRLMQHNISYF